MRKFLLLIQSYNLLNAKVLIQDIIFLFSQYISFNQLRLVYKYQKK